jgi:hypothetical protein
VNAHQARKHTRKVRAGQPVPLQLHRINTSLLPEDTTCTVAGRCTHDCDEGRSCTCSTPDSRAERARVWRRYILPSAAITAIGWATLAWLIFN